MAEHLRLHAQLRYTGVWRQFLLPRSASFLELHRRLQRVFGWDDEHLYLFSVGGEVVTTHPAHAPYVDPRPAPAEDVPVSAHFVEAGDSGLYRYDFGDGWEVELRVEGTTSAPADVHWVLDGALAGPPEDCGGVPGYERLCAVIATGEDPWGDDPAELRRWAEGWSPEAFDPAVEPPPLGGSPAPVLGASRSPSVARWAAVDRAMPFYLRQTKGGPALRIRTTLVVDLDSTMVVAAELNRPLSDTLRLAAERAGGMPGRLLVESEADSQRARFAFKGLDVSVGTDEALEHAWASLLQSFGDERHEPFFVEPGQSPEVVGAFFRAMAAMHSTKPWTVLDETQYLRLRAPALAIDDGVLSVLGSLGVSPGVVVYDSVDVASAFVRHLNAGSERLVGASLGGGLLNAGFARRADLSPAMRRQLKAHGWRHPRGKVPNVTSIEADGVIGPIFDDDYRVATLAAEAITEAMARTDELDGGSLTFSFRTELLGVGVVEAEVSYPVAELDALEAELFGEEMLDDEMLDDEMLDDEMLDDEMLDDEEDGFAGVVGDLRYEPEVDPDPAEWLSAEEGDRHLAVSAAHDGQPMGGSPSTHLAVHVLVENQLAADDPPGARIGLARLLADGLTRHDAIHALGSVVAEEIFAAMSQGVEPDNDRLSDRLASVSAADWHALAEPPKKRKGTRRRGYKRKRRRR